MFIFLATKLTLSKQRKAYCNLFRDYVEDMDDFIKAMNGEETRTMIVSTSLPASNISLLYNLTTTSVIGSDTENITDIIAHFSEHFTSSSAGPHRKR